MTMCFRCRYDDELNVFNVFTLNVSKIPVISFSVFE